MANRRGIIPRRSPPVKSRFRDAVRGRACDIPRWLRTSPCLRIMAESLGIFMWFTHAVAFQYPHIRRTPSGDYHAVMTAICVRYLQYNPMALA